MVADLFSSFPTLPFTVRSIRSYFDCQRSIHLLYFLPNEAYIFHYYCHVLINSYTLKRFLCLSIIIKKIHDCFTKKLYFFSSTMYVKKHDSIDQKRRRTCQERHTVRSSCGCIFTKKIEESFIAIVDSNAYSGRRKIKTAISFNYTSDFWLSNNDFVKRSKKRKICNLLSHIIQNYEKDGDTLTIYISILHL
jgi:hypothetical protein